MDLLASALLEGATSKPPENTRCVSGVYPGTWRKKPYFCAYCLSSTVFNVVIYVVEVPGLGNFLGFRMCRVMFLRLVGDVSWGRLGIGLYYSQGTIGTHAKLHN